MVICTKPACTDVDLCFTGQQTPVCSHRSVQPHVQRPLPRGRGYTADLRQIPGEERRAEGAVWEGTAQRFLPRKVLGKSKIKVCKNIYNNLIFLINSKIKHVLYIYLLQLELISKNIYKIYRYLDNIRRYLYYFFQIQIYVWKSSLCTCTTNLDLEATQMCNLNLPIIHYRG